MKNPTRQYVVPTIPATACHPITVSLNGDFDFGLCGHRSAVTMWLGGSYPIRANEHLAKVNKAHHKYILRHHPHHGHLLISSCRSLP